MLINYNFTRFKCDQCQKLFTVKPGEKLEEIHIRCDCQDEKPKAKKKEPEKKSAPKKNSWFGGGKEDDK